jgi:hypothetical protein
MALHSPRDRSTVILPWLRASPSSSRRRVLTAFVIALVTATGSSAEPVSNPRIVEFRQSPDHNVMLPGGSPAVTQYVLEVYLEGATAPFHTVNMRKPAPQADGLIRYDFSGSVSGWPLPGGIYESRVAAVGPSGTGRSTRSNPFTFGGSGTTCSYAASPATVSAGSGGGTQAITVTAAAGCSWTASSSAGWIAVSPASGSGNGSVTLTVAANTGTTTRTGTATIAGQTVTVPQAAASCAYSVSPTSTSVASGGGTPAITVTTTSGCSWTAGSSAAWIAASPASGSGSGKVTLTVAANTGATVRTGTAAIAGQTVTVTQAAASTSGPGILEDFEGRIAAWRVVSDASRSGVVSQSFERAAAGVASAHLTTSSRRSRAAIRTDFSDAAGSHRWSERPGTYHWQRARIYVPSATVNTLGATSYLTLAGIWPSSKSDYGWYLRVRQGGTLYVAGRRDSDRAKAEFPVYATIPTDRWVAFEIGLHSQAGPGIKRAFAFVLDGDFYGWYRQGRMRSETYDRVSVGVLDSNVKSRLEVFVDEWGTAGKGALPTGTDRRSTAALQEQDFRRQSGVQWQIDAASWANGLRMDPVAGLYSTTSHVHSGRTMDRRSNLTSGWAEIEVGWPNGRPSRAPTAFFGPLVGFRQEVNRQQHLAVVPYGHSNGQVDLVLAAWNGSEPVMLAQWPMRTASMGGTEIPEPGDVIRVRWEQVTSTDLEVRASYYDASARTWHRDVIAHVVRATNLGGVNFADGHHTASFIAIGSPEYSIRRYKLGTVTTYPE